MFLSINSEDSLLWAADYCHDAIFETGQIKYEKDNKIFTLKLIREIWEEPERGKRIFFIQRWRMPKIYSVLTLHNVIEATIHISEPEDVLEDINYDAKKNLIGLKGMKGTRISLKVKELRGVLEDMGEKYFDSTTFATFKSLSDNNARKD